MIKATRFCSDDCRGVAVREGTYYFALYIHCAVRNSVRFTTKKKKKSGIGLDKLIGLKDMVISCVMIRSEKDRSG